MPRFLLLTNLSIRTLAELWAEPKLNLRAIARTLRVSCDAARKNAVKLGLPLARPGHQPLSARSYRHLFVSKKEMRRQNIENLRAQWLEARCRYPDLCTRRLRQKIPAVFATLYRYDRDWLKAHQPPVPKRKSVVDWNDRDQAMCRRLESAARLLKSVTPFRLARAVGIRGWVSDPLARLPQAKKTWQRLLSKRWQAAEAGEIARN